jgi:signal transduction histidine kinase
MSVISGNSESGGHASTSVMPNPIDRARLEELAEHAVRLARQNEALDDATGLIAHEVKSVLLNALEEDQPRNGLIRALDLVDTVLETVRAGQSGGDVVPVAKVVQWIISDLGGITANVSTRAPGVFPLPFAALRIVLRNLLANALAARAGDIHISTLAGGERQMLVVDDDGVGLQSVDGYACGEQLGLALCRRLVARFGGTIELRRRPAGGTRAVISIRGGNE